MNLKERIRNMNIVKSYLRKYIYDLPFYSREKAISLIEDIEKELYELKKNKEKKEKSKDIQLSIF